MRRAAFFLVGLIIVASGGAFLWRTQHSSASANGQALARPAPTVHVAAVAQRDMPVYVRGIGQVQPFNIVQIKSRVDGQIDKILFTEGQQVQAGDVLIGIDPRPYQAAVGQIIASIRADQAALDAARQSAAAKVLTRIMIAVTSSRAQRGRSVSSKARLSDGYVERSPVSSSRRS